MAIKKADGRQWVIAAVVKVEAADVEAGGQVVADLPAGARVVGGYIVVDTAFDSTTNTLDVGDSGQVDRYTSAAPVDLQTLGDTALTVDGSLTDDSTKYIVGTYAETGTAPTVGSARVIIEYVEDDRANEVQG